MYRERVRFRAGPSELLGITLDPPDGDGTIVDARAVAELRAVGARPAGVTAGAFAPLADVTAVVPQLAAAAGKPAAIRLRLSLLGATVTVAGLGRSRTVGVDALTIAPHELPTLVEIPALRSGVGFADRRRVTADGPASFTLAASVALRVSVLGRFEGVRIVLDLDGVVARALRAEEKLERQRVDPGLFPEAGRLATLAIDAVDARTSSAARAATPLVVATLRDALDAARATS